MDRRTFIASAGMTAAALSLSPELIAAKKKNKLPQWKGFNLLDFFSPDPKNARKATTESPGDHSSVNDFVPHANEAIQTLGCANSIWIALNDSASWEP